MSVRDRAAKARLEVNASENALARALYAFRTGNVAKAEAESHTAKLGMSRALYALDRLDAEIAGGAPAPEPVPVPEPEKKPDPKPEPVTTPTLTVDGKSFATTPATTLKTRSGTWRLHTAGEVAPDTTGYVQTLDENPAFVRVLLVRRTAEEAEGEALAARTHQVEAKAGAATVAASLLTVQGACRVAENVAPVRPNPDWLRAAVKAGKLPLYPRTSSWGKVLPALSVPTWAKPGYDPASLGVGDDGRTPTGASNFIGRTDSSGGEYVSSRGYLHNTDARFVAAAVEGDDASVAACFDWLKAQTYFAAAMPQGGVWSASLHGLVDPQLPQAGERAWSRGLGKNQNRPAVALMPEATGWGRNTAHLENVGFVHWLLTEDPLAGLVVQRQLQFALAEYYAYKRPADGLTAYRPCVEEPRAAYNTLSALQKASVVAEGIGAADNVLWGADRLAKMAAGIWDWFDRNRLAPLSAPLNGTAAQADCAARRITGADLMSPADDAAPYKKQLTDGSYTYFRTASDFQQPQYGKEPLYLWTMAGYPAAAKALRQDTLGAINRLLYIGGALGAGEMPSSTGSGMFYGPFSADGKQFLASDGKAWAAWVRATWPDVSTTTFDTCHQHTAEQLRGTLVYARAAIAAGKLPEDAEVNRQTIDAALAAFDAAAKATTKWTVTLMVKHLGRPAA